MILAPLHGIGEVEPGADIADVLLSALTRAALTLEAGDIIVVTQKIVSKAENRFVDLASVTPSSAAVDLAAATRKDARLVELVLRESVAIVRSGPGLIISRHRLGFVMANAGIDRSNVGPGQGERVLLLPEDPDASAERLRQALQVRSKADVAVVISDSFGRPWRLGVVNIAIGAAGIAALDDRRGKPDRDGRPLEVTQVALADVVASAAGIVAGEGDEGVPAVLVRGVDPKQAMAVSAASINRPLDEDLFQ